MNNHLLEEYPEVVSLLEKLSNYKLDKLLIEDPTLEDLFLHYYN